MCSFEGHAVSALKGSSCVEGSMFLVTCSGRSHNYRQAELSLAVLPRKAADPPEVLRKGAGSNVKTN